MSRAASCIMRKSERVFKKPPPLGEGKLLIGWVFVFRCTLPRSREHLILFSFNCSRFVWRSALNGFRCLINGHSCRCFSFISFYHELVTSSIPLMCTGVWRSIQTAASIDQEKLENLYGAGKHNFEWDFFYRPYSAAAENMGREDLVCERSRVFLVRDSRNGGRKKWCQRPTWIGG